MIHSHRNQRLSHEPISARTKPFRKRHKKPRKTPTHDTFLYRSRIEDMVNCASSPNKYQQTCPQSRPQATVKMGINDTSRTPETRCSICRNTMSDAKGFIATGWNTQFREPSLGVTQVVGERLRGHIHLIFLLLLHIQLRKAH